MPIARAFRRSSRRWTGLVAIGLVLGVGAACGSDGDDSAPSPTTTAVSNSAGGARAEATDTVVIKGFVFLPARPEVHVGDTVTVKNEDGALHSLTAAQDPALFDTGQFSDGEREIRFTQAGTFDFTCSVHSYMTGVIQVLA